MPPSKAKAAIVAKRRADAIKLRLAGVDYQTIADRLGYKTRGAACQDISRALEKHVAEQTIAVEALREAETARLDRLQAGIWSDAVAGDLNAIEKILKIIDRRCKLLGLDKPSQVEVITLDTIDTEIRKLQRELQELGPDTPVPSE